MSGAAAAWTGLGILVALLALRMPIAPAMLLVGMSGYAALAGPAPLLGYLKSGAYWRFAVYDFAVIPMFLLMGQVAARSGLGQRLFAAASAFLGHRRGGIAMAAVGGCAAFGAICGSSLATAGTMTRVALPELQRYGYSGALAIGALAAGGTLGILIPPSVVLIVYAVAVEANIVTLFEAALLPGVLAFLLYLLTIRIYVRFRPGAGPAGRPATAAQRLRAVADVLPVAGLFALVIGGIYLGLFDPTEAAAVGAVGSAALAWWHGAMSRDDLLHSLLDVAGMTGMIFLILFGAELVNVFLALAAFPEHLAGLVQGGGLNPHLVLALIIILYLVLGCVMDSLAMIFLTVPILWPIVAALDFGLPVADLQIWFGILVLMVVELGLMTPPVGLNVLIINAYAPDVSLRESFAGALPFVVAGLLQTALLVAFPAIALWLPHLLWQ